MNRYLGIDYGEKRVGIAISDPTLIIAQPLKTVQNNSKKQVINEIQKIIQEQSVNKIVLGLPVTMKGTDSEKTKEVRLFAENLAEDLHLPVYFIDERLTTLQAHLTLHQMGKKPSRNKEKVDQLAAQSILQTFLDREKNRGYNEREK